MKKAAFRLAAFMLAAVFIIISIRNGEVMGNGRTFDDVPESHWAFDYIRKAYERGYGAEIDGNLYEPDKSVTRAEFVQMIVTYFKLPVPDGAKRYFDDVGNDAEYFDAIAAAKNAGILEGIKADGVAFMPGQPITREEAASILSWTTSYLGIMTTMQYINLDGIYEDYPQVDQRYYGAMQTVYHLGLMTGVSKIMFAPKEPVTRAQAAVILVRLLNTAERVLG